MSWKSTIIVFVLAIVCVFAASYVWYGQQALAWIGLDEFGSKSTNNDLSDEGTNISGRVFSRAELPVDDVSRITLERRDQPTLIFERDTLGQWWQVEPFRYPLDPFSIRKLPVLASELTSSADAEVDSENDDDSLGFNPPLASITFEADGYDSQEILLGSRTVAGRAYARKGSDGSTLVVNRDLHERVIDEDPKFWRETDIFQHAGVESTLVQLQQRPAGQPELTPAYEMKKEQRRWSLTQPVQTRLSQQAVEQRLGLLADINTADFIADQPAELAEFGLDEPLLTLSVTTPVKRADVNGRVTIEDITEKLLVGSPRTMEATEFYILLEGIPVVRALPSKVIDELRTFGQLIDQTATGQKPEDIKSIRISGHIEFTLERDDEDPSIWKAVEYVGGIVDPQVVARFLENLTQVQATQAAIGDYPYDREVAYITFSGFDRMPLDTVRIAKADDGSWIMSDGGGVLRIFPPSMQLPLTANEFGLQ